MNKSVGRFLLAVVVLTIISMVIHSLDGFVGLKFYQDPAYGNVWSKLMMPEPGPPPAAFMYASLAFTLISSLLFVLVYNVFKRAFAEKSPAGRGLTFGFSVFLVSGFPAALAMYLVMNLPLGLIILWTVEDFGIKLLGGMSVGAITK